MAAATTERLAIGTFNLKNLGRPKQEPAGNNNNNNNSNNNKIHSLIDVTMEEYEKKLEWTAEQLRRMDADVVGFQEVIHRASLESVLQRAGNYANATLIVGDEDGIFPTIGLVSRLPVRHYEFYKNFPSNSVVSLGGHSLPIDQWTRPILRVVVECHNGQRISVFVAHLKSMRPDFRLETGIYEHDFLERAVGKTRSLIRRATEALALRSLLLPFLRSQEMPQIVLGDLNDQAGSATLDLITGTPPWRMLSSSKKQEVMDHLLMDVADLQARRSERHQFYTHIHNGKFEALDHIMVSRHFYDKSYAESVGLVEYVRTFTDHLIDMTISTDKVPAWQSDHGQLMAILRIVDPHGGHQSLTSEDDIQSGRASRVGGRDREKFRSSPAPAYHAPSVSSWPHGGGHTTSTDVSGSGGGGSGGSVCTNSGGMDGAGLPIPVNLLCAPETKKPKSKLHEEHTASRLLTPTTSTAAIATGGGSAAAAGGGSGGGGGSTPTAIAVTVAGPTPTVDAPTPTTAAAVDTPTPTAPTSSATTSTQVSSEPSMGTAVSADAAVVSAGSADDVVRAKSVSDVPTAPTAATSDTTATTSDTNVTSSTSSDMPGGEANVFAESGDTEALSAPTATTTAAAATTTNDDDARIVFNQFTPLAALVTDDNDELPPHHANPYPKGGHQFHRVPDHLPLPGEHTKGESPRPDSRNNNKPHHQDVSHQDASHQDASHSHRAESRMQDNGGGAGGAGGAGAGAGNRGGHRGGDVPRPESHARKSRSNRHMQDPFYFDDM